MKTCRLPAAPRPSKKKANVSQLPPSNFLSFAFPAPIFCPFILVPLLEEEIPPIINAQDPIRPYQALPRK